MKYKSTLARGLSHAWPWTKPIGSSPTASRLLRYSLLCMLILLCGGSAWADGVTESPYKHVFSTTEKTFTATGETKVLSNVSWTLDATWFDDKNTDYNKDDTWGLKMGSNKKPVKTIVLTSKSGDIPGTITSVKVSSKCRSGATCNLSVSVGGTTFTYGTDDEKSVAISKDGGTYEFTGTGSGSIVITCGHSSIAGSSGAIYIKDIEVTFSTSKEYAKKPVIEPANGTVFKTSSQKVTITSETEGATILYTLNGGDQQTYTGPFTITETTTIKAWATKEGMEDSQPTTATITYKDPTLIVSADFNDLTEQSSSSFNYTNADGTWTGVKMSPEVGFVKLGTSSEKGTVTTPKSEDFTQYAILTFKAKQYNSSEKSVTVTISGDGSISGNTEITDLGEDFAEYKVKITGGTANTQLTISAKRAYIDDIVIKTSEPFVVVTEPTFSPAGGTYEEAQTVELNTTTDGATTYYSTDGENFSVYSGAISVTETTTISAYTKKGEEVSATVTATYTINPPITTIADLNAAAIEGGTSGASVKFKFTDIYVAYASGSYNYITDGTNYALLYGSNLGLTAGDQISGSLTGNAKVYNGLPEIVVTASDLSILSQTAGAFTPEASIVTVDQLSDNVNKFIKIENATYVSASGSNLTFKVGETDFTVRNQFSLDVSGLEANKAYNITGFGSVYNTTYQIYPTAITEYVAPTPAPLYILGDMANWDRTNPTAMAWDSENEVYTYTFTSTAAATYFCFADGTQTAEEAAADNEWTTFNSTYRIAYNEGGYDAPTNSETPIQLAKVNSGDATIILPAGQWTISVSADMKMTITGEATPVTPTEAKYYVVGNMTAWDVDKAYEMTRNEGADIDEYSFTMDLTTESQFKVVKVEEGKENVWYPDGMGNNYGENGEITADGTYTIYFRPNYDGGNDWFYNCIYVAANEPEPFVFRDIKLDLTVQGFLTDDEYNNKSAVTAKLLVDEEGNISRNDDATEPNVIVTGNTRKDNHGWDNLTMTVPVTGKVKITIGGCEYNSSSKVLTVTPEGGEAFTIAAPAACWHSAKTKNIKSGYFDAGEQTVTLTITGPQYTPYVAIEAVDEIPSIYTVTYAKESDVEGTIPAEVEVTIGEAITLPKNYTLYKEGYTQSGWTDGNTTFELGGSFTPEDDVTLTAVFTENTVSLADRTEAVTVTFALDGSKAQYGFQGGTGIIVTQTTVNGETIDVKAATSGKFAYNDGGCHQMNNGSKVAVPSCKDATIVVNGYQKGYTINANNTAMTGNDDNSYTYTATTDNAIVEIAATADNTYINSIVITLPKVESTEPGGEKVLYSWDAGTETGGTITPGGTTRLTINGKTDYSADVATLVLDKALHAGDIISVTGARDKNATGKLSGFKAKFDKGGEVASTTGTEFVNINSAVAESDEYATEPNTRTFEVPAEADGSKTITITRSHSQTNLFIYKLVITTTAEDDPNAVATPEITPATGTYTTDQEVAITCATEGATIYYTTDGNDPTAESTEYTAAFTVTETTTVKAIAIKGEYSSEIAESVITIRKDLQPGESDLIWDYTETAPASSPDNGLTYGSKVDDASVKGVKLNGSGFAWFTKNPVEGKLTLTFGLRSGAGEYAVNVYSCDANGTKGDLIGEVSVSESPGTGSLDIPATVTGIRIERKTGSEGVLQKIVFKEKVPRTFVDFEITNEQLKGTIADMNLPQGVTLTGTQPEAGNNSHGYINASISVPTDGGAVKFTFGGCQYANKSFTVTNSNNETIATLSNKTTNCYHQDASVVTYFYTGEATTLTFSTIPYLPYFKAEATDVQEVTVTFKDQNGTELGKKTVLEGQAIGEVPFTEANLTIPEGEKFRGWVYASGVKVQATDIVEGNKTVSASVTPIETVTEGSIQTYDLTKATFYPEDHETIKVENAAWHDSQHGFSVANGSTISVQTAGKAQVVVTLCQHSAEGTVTVNDANGNPVGEGFNAKVATCGTTAVVNYDGEATWLTFTFSATAYIHSIKVYNVTDFVEKDEESGWYIVPANDGVGLVLALNAASQEADGANIFLPNGTYDLGETVLTAIGGKNVSLIGESMDGVIIKNAPPVAIEGLKTTATLHNTGENLYLQDLTIQNALDYYSAGSAGRGIAFWDEGKHTIAKNVKLLSYQDTYLSTVNQQFYWETSEIHGAVDFICGGSDVFFESTKIVTESRAATGKSGEATITAPQPGTQEQFGYVFNNCTIDNNAAKFNLGRAWGGNSGNGPKQAYLNTTIMQPDEIISTRFTTAGMNEAAKSFKEYNSKNSEGTVISPTSNILEFTHSTGNYEYETILSETEAANYALDKVFPSWSPATDTKQVTAPKAELKGGVITWEKVDGATAYAIFKDGKFLGITTGNEWTIEEVAGAPALLRDGEDSSTAYTIRAANGRGGFGVPEGVTLATGIQQISKELGADVKIYDLNGRRVTTPTTGVYIINGKKVVIK